MPGDLSPSDATLRARVDAALAAGLRTDWAQRAYTSEQVNAVCLRLHDVPANAVEARLAIAGFTRHPYIAPEDEDGIEQSCAVCMYYERHRRFCTLPELMLPVEPTWSCILWRI